MTSEELRREIEKYIAEHTQNSANSLGAAASTLSSAVDSSFLSGLVKFFDDMLSQEEFTQKLDSKEQEVADLRAQMSRMQRTSNARSEAAMQGLVSDVEKENKYIARLAESAKKVLGQGRAAKSYLGWSEVVHELYAQTVGAMPYSLPALDMSESVSRNLLASIKLSAENLCINLDLENIADLEKLDYEVLGITEAMISAKVIEEANIFRVVLVTSFLYMDADMIENYVAHEDTQKFLTTMTKLRLLALNLSKKSLTQAKELSEKGLLLNYFVELFDKDNFKQNNLEGFVELMESVYPEYNPQSIEDGARSNQENEYRVAKDHLLLLSHLDLDNAVHKAALEKYFNKSYDKVIRDLIRMQKEVLASKGDNPGYVLYQNGGDAKYKVLASYNEDERIFFSKLKYEQNDLESSSRELEGFYHTGLDYFRVEQYLDSISEMSLSDKVTLSNLLKEYIYAFKKAIAERHAISGPEDLSEQERFDLDSSVVKGVLGKYCEYKAGEINHQEYLDAVGVIAAGRKVGLSSKVTDRVKFPLSLERLSHRLAQEVKACGVGLGDQDELEQVEHESLSNGGAAGAAEDRGVSVQSELAQSQAAINRAGLSIASLRENHRSDQLSKAVTAKYQGLYERLVSDGDRGFVEQVKARSEAATQNDSPSK